MKHSGIVPQLGLLLRSVSCLGPLLHMYVSITDYSYLKLTHYLMTNKLVQYFWFLL